MKLLIIGSGGREHAIAWKCAQSPNIDTVFVAPGNAGTAREPNMTNVAIDVLDIDALLQFAKTESIALTIVGPEAPLAAGVVDAFQAAGLLIFGPTQAAAQLESSKAFSKHFMSRHGIPTASFDEFTNPDSAKQAVRAQSTYPIVIKADYLAAGKGVIIAQNEQAALDAVDVLLPDNDDNKKIVIESFLVGEEASFIVMVDGKNACPFASSQDHKARDDGDKGPNTGGMGAYSPAPVITPALHDKIMQQVITPTIQGMAAEGNPFSGFLYAGLMISPNEDIHVLEFNCRLGDPETQVILPRLQSDFVDLLLAGARQQLHTVNPQWDSRTCLGVVLAAGGYPGNYEKGLAIQGIDVALPDTHKLFHAGTRENAGEICTNGGRVLCLTALGDSVTQAQKQAYQAISAISWPGMFHRTDIGYRAIEREQVSTTQE